MPTISAFFGICIRLSLRDHSPPHFHAFYGESRFRRDRERFEVVEGHLPAVARRLVREWTFAHRQELVDDRERARAGLPLERIAGLDND